MMIRNIYFNSLIVSLVFYLHLSVVLCADSNIRVLSVNGKEAIKKQAIIKEETGEACSHRDNLIESIRDLQEITNCETVDGSIFVKSFKDGDVLEFGRISEIKGDLIVFNVSNLKTIHGPNLNSIGGNFELNTLTSLQSIELPQLETVDSITWKVLPILSKVVLERGIKKIQSVTMSDTSLTGFGGFNVESLRVLNINNNRFLEKIESSVSEITDEVLISANAKEIQVLLPNLSYVKSLTIKETSNINLQNLQVVDNSAEFINNKFNSLRLPKLKSTGNTLSIMGNPNLKELDFSLLNYIGGGLMIIDNENVNKVDFFPNLKTIGGAVELQGNIDQTSFKGLKIVKGSAIIKSSSVNFDCSKWIKNEVGNVVRGGKVECGTGGERSTKVLLINQDGDVTPGAPGINEESDKKTGGGSVDSSKDLSSSGYRNIVSLSLIVGATVLYSLLFFDHPFATAPADL